MTVYVDSAKNPYRGMIMCHMMADSLDELHEMADQIGVQRKWFQSKSIPHYDICISKRMLAIKHGALEIDRRKLIELVKKYRTESGMACGHITPAREEQIRNTTNDP